MGRGRERRGVVDSNGEAWRAAGRVREQQGGVEGDGEG